MEAILYLLLLTVNALVFRRLARYLTETRKPVFNVKPFNCWPCLAFWLTLLSSLALTYFINAAYLVAVVVAFINYFYINSKFKVYE